jgi:hypothetical protein
MNKKYELDVQTVTPPINNMLEVVKKFEILEKDDLNFLMEKREHLCKVFEKNFIWRTAWQKESIVSDYYFPTLHSKFHQAIAEQKNQTEQLFYLLKDVEMKKIEIEELFLDIEEIEEKESITNREELALKKLRIERDFKLYELKQMKTVLYYRMDEVKGWQFIQERLITQMTEKGYDDEYIWNKDIGEIEDMFFLTLNNFQGIKSTTDGAEHNNLVALATFAIQRVKDIGLFETLVQKCNVIQLQSLEMLGMINIHKPEETK